METALKEAERDYYQSAAGSDNMLICVIIY